jgi:hypothetical protein
MTVGLKTLTLDGVGDLATSIGRDIRLGEDIHALSSLTHNLNDIDLLDNLHDRGVTRSLLSEELNTLLVALRAEKLVGLQDILDVLDDLALVDDGLLGDLDSTDLKIARSANHQGIGRGENSSRNVSGQNLRLLRCKEGNGDSVTSERSRKGNDGTSRELHVG